MWGGMWGGMWGEWCGMKSILTYCRGTYGIIFGRGAALRAAQRALRARCALRAGSAPLQAALRAWEVTL